MRDQQACSDFRRVLPSRRQLLQVGALGTLGLSLPAALRAEARSGLKVRAKSVIFLHQFGGCRQQDTFDMKPNAPARATRRVQADPLEPAGPRRLRVAPPSVADHAQFYGGPLGEPPDQFAQLGGLLLADGPPRRRWTSSPPRPRRRTFPPTARSSASSRRAEKRVPTFVVAALDDRRRRVPHAGPVRGLSRQGTRSPVYHQESERPELLGRGAHAAHRGAAGARLERVRRCARAWRPMPGSTSRSRRFEAWTPISRRPSRC